MIEIVVTIVLIGIVIIPILEAVRTGIHASSVAREAAEVETALINAADRVNRAPKKCDYTVYAQAAVQTQGWSPSQATVAHQYFVPGDSPLSPGHWATGTTYPACAGIEPTDLLVQRVVITIRSPDGHITRSIEVVKSDV